MPTRHAKRFASYIALWAVRIFGGALTFFGLVSMLTPIPFGLVFFVIGLLLLVPSTPGTADAVRWSREKLALFDKALTKIGDKSPVPIRRVLRMTEPGNTLGL